MYMNRRKMLHKVA